MMIKHKGQLLDNRDGSTSCWQVRLQSADVDKTHLYKQTSPQSGASWSIWLGILFTIGFLALLVITTLRTIL